MRLMLPVVRLKTLSDVCYERCHVSCGASVTSSEASTDEFCVDDDVSTSLFPVVEDQEYLSLNVFEMGTLTGRERHCDIGCLSLVMYGSC